MSLKLLANVFKTSKGRASMQDPEKAKALIEFCNKSFSSCNHKVAFHAALVLFNYLLAFENQSKVQYQALLQLSVRALCDEILSKESITDKDTLVAALLCICRCLYKNHEVTVWVEKEFKEPYQQTMAALEARASENEVKEAIKDALSMVSLEE